MRERMLRAVRETLDRHRYGGEDNSGRAAAAVLAVEPIIDAEREALREARRLARRAKRLAYFSMALAIVSVVLSCVSLVRL
jgi:membrane protein required for beta-lactamase induction